MTLSSSLSILRHNMSYSITDFCSTQNRIKQKENHYVHVDYFCHFEKSSAAVSHDIAWYGQDRCFIKNFRGQLKLHIKWIWWTQTKTSA